MQDSERVLFEQIKNYFRPKRVVKVGDVGIYQDVLSLDTFNDATHTLKYDIYAKIRALAVFDNLVEVEILDMTTLSPCNQDIKTIIDISIPKYIKSKYVKWEVK